MMTASEVQMVPRLPPELTAGQSKLVYDQRVTHPRAHAQALRDELGLPSLALFPTLHSPGDDTRVSDAGCCRP